LKARGNEARDQIRCSAGRERHYQADGLGWPSPLRMRAHRQKRRRANTQYDAAACNAPHSLAPIFCRFSIAWQRSLGKRGAQALPRATPGPIIRGKPKPQQEIPHATW
jgi:hypothetical protein